MPRCGECKYFVPLSSNSAASDGYCNAFLDDDGVGREVNIYNDASKCPVFEELGRIRTNVSEFMWDPLLRTARGFEEK